MRSFEADGQCVYGHADAILFQLLPLPAVKGLEAGVRSQLVPALTRLRTATRADAIFAEARYKFQNAALQPARRLVAERAVSEEGEALLAERRAAERNQIEALPRSTGA